MKDLSTIIRDNNKELDKDNSIQYKYLLTTRGHEFILYRKQVDAEYSKDFWQEVYSSYYKARCINRLPLGAILIDKTAY